MKSIETSFLEYHKERGFSTPEPFPLVIDDPTVLFTNATITPYKSMFSGKVPFENFAFIQRCLRLGGTGGTVETARTNTEYTSLFDMLGSGYFEVSHQEALDYFLDALDALGMERKKMIFSSVGAYALGSTLEHSALDSSQIRIFDNPDELQHEWSFGDGDLHGQGIIAWFTPEGYEQRPALSDCLQIGRIVHIDGVSEGENVLQFEHTAFDLGLGMGRVEKALTGDNKHSMTPWRKLAEQFKNTFDGISEGDAHYMANLCCIADELISEGLVPGKKKQAYALRKTIRSLIEEVWIQAGALVGIQDALNPFIQGSMSGERLASVLTNEESALRQILSQAESKRRKHPGMTLDDLHGTFGIKPSLLKLMQSA